MSTNGVVSISSSPKRLLAGIFIPRTIRRLLNSTTSETEIAPGEHEVSSEPAVVPTPVPPSSSSRTTSRPKQVSLAIEPSDPPRTHHAPVVPLHRYRRCVINPIAKSKPFDFEYARLELLKLLELRRDGDQVSYDVRDILRRSILDHDGMATMFAHELVQRITRQTEKRYDLVATVGEYGAIFGARIADALIAKYGQGYDVTQRFLELFTPAAAEGMPQPSPEYRLQRARSEKSYLLSGRRVVFAVPVVTPENWPEVLQQAAFLRSEQANSAEVCIVAITRIGCLETDTPTGLVINAIIDFR